MAFGYSTGLVPHEARAPRVFSFTSRPPSNEVVTAVALSAADKVKQRLAALRGDGLPVC
jgi:hypothetical protein